MFVYSIRPSSLDHAKNAFGQFVHFLTLTTPAVLCLIVTGCAQFENRPLSPSESFSRLEARTLNDPDLLHFIEAVSIKLPTNTINSWKLDKLTLAALYYHPDFALARAQAGLAEAGIKTAGQRLNPTITLTPTWVSNLATAAVPWIAASTINIPIETANKRGIRVNKSAHLTEASRWRVADAAWLIRGRLRTAMLEAYAAKEAEQIIGAQVKIQRTITQKIEQQQMIGELGPLELRRSRLALSQLELSQKTAQKRVADSRVLIASAIGIPVEVLSDVDIDFSELANPPALTNIPVDKLKEIALRTRPDVLAALADYEAAQSALQLEIANQYPNIQLNPAYTWEMGEHRWALGTSALQLPIFHQNQGPIAEVEAKRKEMATRFDALQLKLMGDIDKARAGIAAIQAKWSSSEQQQKVQNAQLDSAQALYRVGETDRLTLLTAELEVAVLGKAHLDVLVETQQALGLLEDTLRVPLGSSLTGSSLIELAHQNPSE
jgi:outer membrane protein, heavy metal efflux system